jgi:hypothetical protein
MSENQTNRDKSWLELLATWGAVAAIVAYIVALNVLAFFIVLPQH